MAVTGVCDTRPGREMREPVTDISSTSCAYAVPLIARTIAVVALDNARILPTNLFFMIYPSIFFRKRLVVIVAGVPAGQAATGFVVSLRSLSLYLYQVISASCANAAQERKSSIWMGLYLQDGCVTSLSSHAWTLARGRK